MKRFLYISYLILSTYLSISLVVSLILFNNIKSNILVNLVFVDLISFLLISLIALNFWFRLAYSAKWSLLSIILSFSSIWVLVIVIDWIKWEVNIKSGSYKSGF